MLNCTTVLRLLEMTSDFIVCMYTITIYTDKEHPLQALNIYKKSILKAIEKYQMFYYE